MSEKSSLDIKNIIFNIIFTVLLSALLAYKIVRMILNPRTVEWLFGSFTENFSDISVAVFTSLIYLAYSASYIMPILTIITLWLRGTPKMVMSLVTLLVSGSLLVWEFGFGGLITFGNQISYSTNRLDYIGFDPLVSLIEAILLVVITIKNMRNGKIKG
ncbi:MAG: hypothetical protein HDT42_11575 [Ruminococcaceae bacterium]|nr:hypothetical protein [Oscillospiraceae bacterium]